MPTSHGPPTHEQTMSVMIVPSDSIACGVGLGHDGKT